MLHFRLQLFNPAHHGHHRSLMQPRRQLVQLFRRAHRVSLHAAVIQVPDPSRQTQDSRLVLHERAEADTLHSARNQPAPRRLLSGRPPAQCICPDASSLSIGAGVPSIALFTAAHRLCSWNGFVMSANPFSTT